MLVLPPRQRIISEHLHVERPSAPPRVEQQLLPHLLAALRPALVLLPESYLGPGVGDLLRPHRRGNVREEVHPLIAQEVEVFGVPRYLGAELHLEIAVLRPLRVDQLETATDAAQDLLEIGFRLGVARHFAGSAGRSGVDEVSSGFESEGNHWLVVMTIDCCVGNKN